VASGTYDERVRVWNPPPTPSSDSEEDREIGRIRGSSTSLQSPYPSRPAFAI